MRESTIRDSAQATRFVLAVAGVIGLCILGDSLMYSILPLEAENLGISLPMVGVLLSINRLIRLLSNTWAGALFARWGPALPFLGSAILGLLSTLAYGLGWGLLVFLAARAAWGIAWSGLRQGGYEAVWQGSGAIKGRLTGLLWGLVRLGSAASALLGGFLYDRYGYSAAVTAIMLLTVPAVPAAWLLDWRRPRAALVRLRLEWPTLALRTRWTRTRTIWQTALARPLQRRLITAGLMDSLLNGVVVATTSLLLAQRLDAGGVVRLGGLGVGSLAGLLLGARWIADLVLGPLAGYLSDQMGQPRAALILVLGLAGAMVAIAWLPGLAILPAVLFLFFCQSSLYVVLSAAASGAATGSASPHHFVGVYTTATDAGSAAGPLLAFTAGAWIGLTNAYLVGGLLLLAAVWRYWRMAE